jgi:hypothetical protein
MMKRLLFLLGTLCFAFPAWAQTWDVRIKELTPAGGVCVTGLLAGILQTAPCSLTINTGPGLTGGPLTSAGTITLAAFRADGRLVASSGIPSGPIPAASVTNATNLFYIPSQNGGDLITIYNGTVAQDYHFGVSGLVLPLGTNWGATSAFDVFAILSGVSPALCTVQWTSMTARATALDATVLPFPTNGASAVCRTSNTTTVTLPANQGTYIGSFYTNAGAGQVDFNFGGSASGGGQASLGVWNAYNKAPVSVLVQDSTLSWTYSGSTYRSADNSNSNSVVFMTGLPGTAVSARYSVASATISGAAVGSVGIFLNLLTSPVGMTGTIPTLSSPIGLTAEAIAEASIVAPIGQNTILAVENAAGSTAAFSGVSRQGLSVQLSM